MRKILSTVGLVIVSLILGTTAIAQTTMDRARTHRAELTRNARALAGLEAPVPVFAAQIHQESAWKNNAKSGVGAQGLSQFMPATAKWISSTYPELATNEPYNPSWALRAVVQYDLWLLDRVKARDECESWAMVLSAYNGGLGWIYKDQKLAQKQGRDPSRWWDHVEFVNSGRSQANWYENRGYPKRILHGHQPLYSDWGRTICLE